MTRLIENRKNIETEWVRLQLHWKELRGIWTDSASQKFERYFWQEYERTLPPLFKGIDSLSAVIDQSKREVK